MTVLVDRRRPVETPFERWERLADEYLAVAKPDTQCERHVILGWNGIATSYRCIRSATVKHEDYEIQLCEKCNDDWHSGKLESYR